MNPLRAFLAVSAAFIGTFAALADAEITWIGGTEYDFGAFAESTEPTKCVFRYVNTGDEDLVITGARASCGCTTPRYDTRPLAPGDTALITVAYDSQGRPGRFAKSVFINANTTPPRSVLIIKGVVVGAPQTIARRFPVDFGPLKMAHSSVILGQVMRRHVKSVFTNGYNGSTDTISPTVAYAPKWLEVTPTPRDVPPGERLSLSFYVNGDRVPLYGANLDSVVIVPDSRHPEIRHTLEISVDVHEDFSKVEPRALARAPQAAVDSELINITCDGDGHAVLRLSNRGKGEPLLIRRVYTLSPALEVSVPKGGKVKKGRTAGIYISTVREALPSDGRPLDARVFVITNDPVTPVITVRVTAACP